ncbi:MAG: hypothetical protein LBC41_04465, partial [Clostridiales bacterium]|nr:hypothetical protein [Clostridiales bacterium]
MPDYAYIRISLESITPTVMQEESSFFYELAVHILFDIRKRNTGVSSEALENLAMIVSDYRNGIEMTSTTFMDAIGAMNEK